MFDKEEYRKSLKKMLPNMSESVIDYQVEIKAKNHATQKRGPNVVHLDYYGGIISDGEKRLNLDPATAITLQREVSGEIYTLPPNDPYYAMPLPENEITGGVVQNPR